MAARKLHVLIYITIVNCCLFLAVCAAALSTNKWFSAKSQSVTENSNSEISVSFGLFSGKKEKWKGTDTTRVSYDLKIVCEGLDGCMFSCGPTSDRRKIDIQNWIAKGEYDLDDSIICIEEDIDLGPFSKAGAVPNADGEPDPTFINFGLYVTTIMFLMLGMIFAIISGALALYNTYRTPYQQVLSVMGLYVWNGVSAAFVLLAMMMWGIEFSTRLRKNAAISDTLSGVQDSDGNASLGVSYWILILPILFALANIGILKYRSWKKIQMNKINVTVMEKKLDNGDILLF